MDFVVRRVYRTKKMERRLTTKDRGRLRKIIRDMINKDLGINKLDRNMVLDRTLWGYVSM